MRDAAIHLSGTSAPLMSISQSASRVMNEYEWRNVAINSENIDTGATRA